jgi:predicted permease
MIRRKLKYLLPWYRHAEERDMREELEALAQIAEPGELGSLTLAAERAREAWGWTWLESLWGDCRFAIRSLRRDPAFVVVVVFSLALGIGANTAIFTLINAALLKMLPVQNPEQLVQFKASDYWLPYPLYKQFRDRNETLSGVLAFQRLDNVDLEVDGRGGIAQGQVVSGNYFAVLGLNAIRGRTIAPADDQSAGGSPVAVISYSYWQSRFSLDPAIIGKQIVINSSPFTIIGVTPPDFFGLEPGERIDVFIPLTKIENVWPGYAAKGTPFYVLTCPVRNWLRVMGRLKPGVTQERALASLQPIYRQAVLQSAPLLNDSPTIKHLVLESKLQLEAGGQGLASLRRRFSKPLLILMAAVVLLLLITCANVANLLLARIDARSKEFAVRLTIGARRARITRQLLTECLLLATTGGAIGLVFAFWGSDVLLSLVSHSSSPISLSVRPDAGVLAFTLLMSLATALTFGLVPVLRGARVDLAPALVESTRSSGKAGGRWRLARSLVVMQIAASLVLLACAGLLMRSLQNLEALNPGFNKENVLLFALNPGLVGYKDADNLYRTLLDRFRPLPGVRAATFSMHSPLSGKFAGTDVRVQGYNAGATELPAGLNFVGPDYFRTLQTPILMGRDFTVADDRRAPKVAIVNEAFAHYYFGDTNPLGKNISIPDWVGDPSWFTIIGLVRDAKQIDLRESSKKMAYIPAWQSAVPSGVTFEVRSSIGPGAISEAIRHAVSQVDGRLPVFNMRTLRDQMDESMLAERLVASLSTVFGVIALVLASIGLYGLMSYAITRRTAEIGIRMALGATSPRIAGMVVGETLKLVLIGFGIGIPAGIVAGRLIKSELYGLQADGVITVLAVIAFMACLSILAAYVPARRASRVEPMTALRME